MTCDCPCSSARNSGPASSATARRPAPASISPGFRWLGGRLGMTSWGSQLQISGCRGLGFLLVPKKGTNSKKSPSQMGKSSSGQCAGLAMTRRVKIPSLLGAWHASKSYARGPRPLRAPMVCNMCGRSFATLCLPSLSPLFACAKPSPRKLSCDKQVVTRHNLPC